jgi:hypothetical protein
LLSLAMMELVHFLRAFSQFCRGRMLACQLCEQRKLNAGRAPGSGVKISACT